VSFGERLNSSIAGEQRQKWQKLIANTYLKHSRKFWKTFKMLETDKTQATSHYNVTANQVAYQLILNEKGPAASLKMQKIQ
jgi:hypothetical protein